MASRRECGSPVCCEPIVRSLASGVLGCAAQRFTALTHAAERAAGKDRVGTSRMTRPTAPLQQHLLTRSDLARMEVPAAQILSWLASGTLEQVGRLPDDELVADPVFTVHTPDLLEELAKRLGAIGKPAVVLTPLAVRSFLMRALLHRRETTRAHTHEEAQQPDTQVGARLLESDLAHVLQEAAADFDADFEAMLRLAEKEAQVEADERASAQGVPRVDEGDDDDIDDTVEEHECFDAHDLANALDGGVSDEVLPAAPASRPSPAANLVETQIDAAESAPLPEQIESISHVPAATARIETATPKPGAGLSGEPGPILGERAVDSTPVALEAAPRSTTTMIATPAETTAIDGEPLAADRSPPPVETQSTGREEPQAPQPAPVDTTHTIAPGPEHLPSAAAVNEAAAVARRVEALMGELSALVEMAQRPQATIDVRPIVDMVQTGFDRSAQQSSVVNSALLSMTEQLRGIGQQVELGVASAVRSAAVPAEPVVPAIPVATEVLVTRDERLPMALFAITVLMLCWSILIWFRTGSPKLALETLVGANVVGCCLLASQRTRN